MSTTAIIVNATDALGKSAQKSVTNVNPAATNSQLVSLGQAINAISNNTYGGTVRIDKTDCDTEPTPAGLGKTATQVTITPTANPISFDTLAEQMTTEGGGEFVFGTVTTSRGETYESKYAVYVSVQYLAGLVYEGDITLTASDEGGAASHLGDVQETGFDITIVALEDDTYAMGAATVHVTFS